jgi:hypothetical protein
MDANDEVEEVVIVVRSREDGVSAKPVAAPQQSLHCGLDGAVSCGRQEAGEALPPRPHS